MPMPMPMPVLYCARADLVPGPSAAITISSANALRRRLLFHVMDRSSYSQRAIANGGTKEYLLTRAPRRSEQRLRRMVTRAPHSKQGREGRKGKNERSWIKDTHGLISWTVGYGRHRRTRVRPIGRRGFPHGLTGRIIGLGFIPGRARRHGGIRHAQEAHASGSELGPP